MKFAMLEFDWGRLGRFSRRWTRYRLRTLLLFVSLASIPAWLWHVRANYREQDHALRELADHVALVDFTLKTPSFLSWPEWLMGKEYYEIETLSLEGVVKVGAEDPVDLVLAPLARLKSVRSLRIDAYVTDHDLLYLSRIGSELVSLKVSGGDHGITDEGLQRISTFSNLQVLGVAGGERFSGKGVRFLASLPLLQGLDISHSKVSDDVTEALASFRNLRTLRMNNVKITSAGLRQLCSSASLRDLYINGSSISATDVAAVSEKSPGLKVHLDWEAEKSVPSHREVFSKYPRRDEIKRPEP